MGAFDKLISRRIFMAAALAGILVAVFWIYRHAQRPTAQELAAQARLALARGETAIAKKIIADLLSRWPQHDGANLLCADLAIREGDLDLALESLARIGDDARLLSAQARLREGIIFLQRGRAFAAEKQLLKSMALDPSGREAERRLRDLYMLQLRRREYRELMRSRRNRHSWTLADLLDFIVVGHIPPLLVGNWMERVRVLAETDPDDSHSQIALATFHATMGQNERAATIAENVLHRAPGNAEALALRVDALLGLGRVHEAASIVEQIPAELTGHPRVLQSVGRVAFLRHDFDRAAQCFEASLVLEPGNPSNLYQWGLSLERVGAIADASTRLRCAKELARLVDFAQRALQTQDDDRGAVAKELYRLAELLAACELWEDSHYCCEFVLQADPKHHGASDLLARTQEKMHSSRAEPVSTAMRSHPLPPPVSDRQAHRVPASNMAQRAVLQFEEVAAKRGVTFEYFTGDTGKKYLFETLGGGVAAFDYDGDGWCDLYFPQGARFPVRPNDLTFVDQLWRNVDGVEFVQVTGVVGLGDANYTIGCASGDFDNDGFGDLFIANYGRNRAYRNNGDGTFSDVSVPLGVDCQGMSTSLALSDLDRDGDLDLYVANYVASIDVCRDRTGHVYACHPSMFAAEQDFLFENRGNGEFVDVTAESGVVAADGKGLGVVTADLDNDGWPDIYVANDSTPSFLFHNVGPRRSAGMGLSFDERGLLAGAALSRDGKARAAMGIACADYDGNGFLDLYVTNYYLETNALFLNQGRLSFVDSVRPASLIAETNPLLGFGTQPIDADLDGHDDLFVTNGHVDDYRGQDRGVQWKMPPKLYRNGGHLAFDDVSDSAGTFFQGEYLGRGVARLDWNRDGRPDLVAVHQNDRVAMLENVTAATGHRVAFEMIGTSSCRDGINTRFWISAGDARRMLEIIGGDGYLGTNERRQIVGLGNQTRVDELELTWLSGRVDRYRSLAAGNLFVIVEGQSPRTKPYLKPPLEK